MGSVSVRVTFKIQIMPDHEVMSRASLSLFREDPISGGSISGSSFSLWGFF